MVAGEKKYKAVVLGVGNILWADEGFGVRAVEALNESWSLPEGVEVLDGGTLGFYLSEYIEGTDNLLIFDCCDMDEPAGTMRVFRNEDIRPWLGTKISAHQEGLNDLFAAAALLGRYPKNIAVVGCEPEELEDYGGSLSETVSARVPKAVETGLAILREWGFEAVRRTEKPKPLSESCLSRSSYETGRPSEGTACRYGDPRFFPKDGGLG